MGLSEARSMESMAASNSVRRMVEIAISERIFCRCETFLRLLNQKIGGVGLESRQVPWFVLRDLLI